MVDIIHVDIILTLIGSVATFFQGFYFRRRYFKMTIVSSFIMILSSGSNIIINGWTTTLFEKMSSISISDLPSFAYVILLWMVGYIIGGFQFSKDKDRDKHKDKVVANTKI